MHSIILAVSLSVSNVSLRIMSHLFTYLLLTSWSSVLHEKLTGLQLVKKFPAFYGTRRFITIFTIARHLSLSWANSIQSIPPLPEYPSNLMSLFRCSVRTKISVQVWGFVCEFFITNIRFHGEELLAPRQTLKLEDHPLSAAYSIYLQLPSILEAVPRSATRGRAMPWWLGSTYHMTVSHNTQFLKKVTQHKMFSDFIYNFCLKRFPF
jgi:hypothetical protein